MKKFVSIVLLLAMCLTLFSACGKTESKKIVIWTSGEDYKNEAYLQGLQEKFPDYDITLEYVSSSTIAAKVIEEGENCSCDIICSRKVY